MPWTSDGVEARDVPAGDEQVDFVGALIGDQGFEVHEVPHDGVLG